MEELTTKSLLLVGRTREDMLSQLAEMKAEEKAQFSQPWLKLLENSGPCDPWIHGFNMLHRREGFLVGSCGFKGPPQQGVVEIAYAVLPDFQGNGYASEAAEALTRFAFQDSRVKTVRAHTLARRNASARVLTKCGFQAIGETTDPEDGVVWRWERSVQAR